MSHELRTPLNAILGYCQLHGHDRTLGTDLQNSLRAIGRAGDHILELVNNILDLVRLEADAMPLNPCWLSASIVPGCQKFFLGQFPGQGTFL